MIMMFGSQRDYDMITGKGTGGPAWTAEDLAALHTFMGDWTQKLVDSGEFVDGQGLSAPVHARRIQLEKGVPVVTDGPYPETQEVLAGYTIVECSSFDRATEVAAQLAGTPHPAGADLGRDWYVDIRPIDSAPPEFEL
jgi:hypothetical protein